jgi:hypothetical protein
MLMYRARARETGTSSQSANPLSSMNCRRFGKGVSDKIILSASLPTATIPLAADAELNAAKMKASKVRVAERMVRLHPIIAAFCIYPGKISCEGATVGEK